MILGTTRSRGQRFSPGSPTYATSLEVQTLFYLHRTLERLLSHVYTLEYLLRDVSFQDAVANIDLQHSFRWRHPRLSYLVLPECDISWTSPLLRGLRYF